MWLVHCPTTKLQAKTNYQICYCRHLWFEESQRKPFIRYSLFSNNLGGGGGFTRPIPRDGGADQFRGIPIVGRLPTDGTRGPKEKGVWPKMARRRGSSTGQSSTRCERSCGSEPQLLYEGVSARPTLWR